MMTSWESWMIPMSPSWRGVMTALRTCKSSCTRNRKVQMIYVITTLHLPLVSYICSIFPICLDPEVLSLNPPDLPTTPPFSPPTTSTVYPHTSQSSVSPSSSSGLDHNAPALSPPDPQLLVSPLVVVALPTSWSKKTVPLKIHDFDSPVGPTTVIPESPLDVFKLYFTEDLLSMIVCKSNRYDIQAILQMQW